MNLADGSGPAVAVRAAARHSVAWLVAGNLVGVWLALVLLWPAVGDRAAPLSYGRWVPLHLDWHLYGWTALPVVGLLLAWFLDPRDSLAGGQARLALGAWSAALALGGGTWLAGSVSGKLFLDWAGFARPLLPAAMLLLWGVLARATWARWSELSLPGRAARAALLAGLLLVPPILWWAEGPDVYPAVNPGSGGATGTSLLGSTLGIVAILLLLPPLLGLVRRPGALPRRLAWLALGAGLVVFAFSDHGHASHTSPGQIAALATLLAWVPLLVVEWRAWLWPPEARCWLGAALGWWGVLVASGWLVFLPGLSEALKFTHGLVAHAHLALAGVVTSVNALMLATLSRRPTPPGVFGLWQFGCALQILVLAVLGAVEAERAGDLFRSEPWTQAAFGLRLAGGLLMLAASVRWLRDLLRP